MSCTSVNRDQHGGEGFEDSGQAQLAAVDTGRSGFTGSHGRGGEHDDK